MAIEGALLSGVEVRVDPVLAGRLARPLLLPAVPKGGDMAQGPCACDRLAVAEPGQDIGRRQGLRQLQLSIAIEPEEAGPVGIGLKESRYLAETGVRVPPPQIEPGDDLDRKSTRLNSSH